MMKHMVAILALCAALVPAIRMDEVKYEVELPNKVAQMKLATDDAEKQRVNAASTVPCESGPSNLMLKDVSKSSTKSRKWKCPGFKKIAQAALLGSLLVASNVGSYFLGKHSTADNVIAEQPQLVKPSAETWEGLKPSHQEHRCFYGGQMQTCLHLDDEENADVSTKDVEFEPISEQQGDEQQDSCALSEEALQQLSEQPKRLKKGEVWTGESAKPVCCVRSLIPRGVDNDDPPFICVDVPKRITCFEHCLPGNSGPVCRAQCCNEWRDGQEITSATNEDGSRRAYDLKENTKTTVDDAKVVYEFEECFTDSNGDKMPLITNAAPSWSYETMPLSWKNSAVSFTWGADTCGPRFDKGLPGKSNFVKGDTDAEWTKPWDGMGNPPVNEGEEP